MLIYVCILIMDEVPCPEIRTEIANKGYQLSVATQKVAWR
jgi:hypothetical protein